MKEEHAIFTVKGKVQGVFYRGSTEKKAKEIGLKGTVRNLPNGDVEIQAVGSETQLKEIEDWCWEGSSYSHVTQVIRQNQQLDQIFQSFRVVY